MLYITRYFYFYFLQKHAYCFRLTMCFKIHAFSSSLTNSDEPLVRFRGKNIWWKLYIYICSGNLKTIVHVTTSKNFTRLNLRVKFLFVMTWRISDVHFLSNNSFRIFTTYVVYTIYFPRFQGVCSRGGCGVLHIGGSGPMLLAGRR